MRGLLLMIFLAGSAAWGYVVWQWALAAWPHLSLDLSHVDPATQAAYRSAENWHMAKYAALALLPPLVVGLVGRGIFGRKA